MPWDNKKKLRSRVGTETPMPAASRSQPPPSSKLSNNFRNLGGLDKATEVSPSLFIPSTPQPQQLQPSPSLMKSLPSRPTPIPAAKRSILKDALLNKASAAANGRTFDWARDDTPDAETSTVSDTPTSSTSLHGGGGALAHSQPTSPPAKKKQKTANTKSALPGWAKREVASSQSTPARKRADSVRSNRSGRSARSTSGPSNQP